MVAFPTKDFIRGMKMLGMAFTDKKQDLGGVTRQIVDLAGLARRDGVLALEGKLAEIQDPFLKKALTYVVDGVDASVTRSSLEAAIEAEHQENMVGAKGWEAAGGFAPTIGILGAVLGLIHVMENLSDPSEAGRRHRHRLRGHRVRRGLLEPALPAGRHQAGSASWARPWSARWSSPRECSPSRRASTPASWREKLRALTGIEGPAAEEEKKAA